MSSVRETRERRYDHDFWPEAMLPGWFVTDAGFQIVRWNYLIDRLADQFDLRTRLESGKSLSLRMDQGEHASFCHAVLAPAALDIARAGIDVLVAFEEILTQAHGRDGRVDATRIFDKLAAVAVDRAWRDHVRPYVFDPKLTPNDRTHRTGEIPFRAGVKLAPPAGLELKRPVTLHEENLSFRHIDLVIACRVMLFVKHGVVVSLDYFGCQVALHDASERHQRWAEEVEHSDKRISATLAHALRSPVSELVETTERMIAARFTPQVLHRELTQHREHLQDLVHLVDLLLFVQSKQRIRARVRPALPDRPLSNSSFTGDTVLKIVADTLESMHRGRDVKAVNVAKVGDLLSAAGMSCPDGATSVDNNCYRRTAEQIVLFEGISPDERFEIFVRDGHRSHFRDIAAKAYTALFRLILIECLINAIKYSDDDRPDVRVTMAWRADDQRLDIDVKNNGRSIRGESAGSGGQLVVDAPGEKRSPLGLILNQRAARALDIDFLMLPSPVEGGTHLRLSLVRRKLTRRTRKYTE
jgi:anti-sigma regulatory factor (Ser/Thr protein kinase)